MMGAAQTPGMAFVIPASVRTLSLATTTIKSKKKPAESRLFLKIIFFNPII